MQDPSSFAIRAALSHDWEKAIALNQEILKENKHDINALCRLAYAYLQTGKHPEAKSLYNKILSLDRYNRIAQKNLDRIKSFPKNFKKVNKTVSQCLTPLSPSLFIEEPGRTKAVSLINLAPSSILSHLNVGEEVVLCAKKHSIEVRNSKKNYLGALPDDIAFRLIRFLKAGNTYHVFIKGATKNSICIFIREIKRGKRLIHQPSFIAPFVESTHSAFKDIKNKLVKSDIEEEVTEANVQEEDSVV
jgi:tetratricopeptide (TPR) repeat protein